MAEALETSVSLGVGGPASLNRDNLKFTSALAAAATNQWDGLGQVVAAVYAGHGGGLDGPCLDIARGIAVSRAAVAAASEGVSTRGGKLQRKGASGSDVRLYGLL